MTASENFLANEVQPSTMACHLAVQVHCMQAIPGLSALASRPDGLSAWSTVRDVIHGRQNVGPRRLREPGPDTVQLEQLIHAAAAAPDHGLLVPWRFVLIPQEKRSLLANAFEVALLERDPLADEASIELARDKAFRGPVLLLAIVRLGPAKLTIPQQERLVSLGCAIQNLLLAAQAMDYSCGLVSGQAVTSIALRSLFRLQPDEAAVCFVSVGTAYEKRSMRQRPQLSQVFEIL